MAKSLALTLGIQPNSARGMLRGWPSYRRDRREYELQRASSLEPQAFPIGENFPIVADKFASSGTASGHYFHQDLVVAREVFERNPLRHIDVGSRIDGLVAHIASFREIEVFDIRYQTLEIKGIRFVQCDLMAWRQFPADQTDSLSCLHAMEHFGLGRYGDAVSYDGWRNGLAGLTHILQPGGMLYLSVPTGEVQRVEFNAHRIFSLPYLRDELLCEYAIERLDFVDDEGKLFQNLDPFSAEAECSFNAHYGCSIWVLRKRIK